MEDPLRRARTAFADRAWNEACRRFAEADTDSPAALGAADLDDWGLAAFLTGADAESDSARERAHAAYLAEGNADGAARVGYWLALALFLRGEGARGNGWFMRVQRTLDDAGGDSVWRGFLLVTEGMNRFFAGDFPGAMAIEAGALEIADRFGDADLRVLAQHSRGQALVAGGQYEAGRAALDEVMVAVTTTDTIYPQLVGLVYCAVIQTCRDTFDVHRSREWTDALSRWCATQPDLVPYRGQCLVHRSEIRQLHGDWPDAASEIDAVFARLGAGSRDPAVGMAFYQRGELHRLRGEDAAAEAAYRDASRVNHDPQPGFALLRWRQGDPAGALAALRRARDEARRPPLRLRLLPALVEVALAEGERDLAAEVAGEIASAAAASPVPLLVAASRVAQGSLRLSESEPGEALSDLREAAALWSELAAPYEAARTRILIADACAALGDSAGAELELDAARWTFTELGAAPDLAALDRRSGPADPRPDPNRGAAPAGLTVREVQVLRLVATGATNRAVAEQLFLSEKTVARHVANIFAKLGVSSRSAATAFAYEQRLT